MTIVYEPHRDPRQYARRFQVTAPATASEVRPGDAGLFIRRPRADRTSSHSTGGKFEAVTGRWGLIPLFARALDYPATFEAPGESASLLRDFAQPWKRGHRCLVLADALVRRGDRSQRLVRVARADGEPLVLAGLWNSWRSPTDECVESFALLTLPSEERAGERRVAFLRDGWVEDWLHCPLEEAAAYLRPYDLDKLVRTDVEA